MDEVATKILVRVERNVSRETWKRERVPGGRNENHARVKRNHASGQNAVGAAVEGAVASGAHHESEILVANEPDAKIALNAADGKGATSGLTSKSKSR